MYTHEPVTGNNTISATLANFAFTYNILLYTFVGVIGYFVNSNDTVVFIIQSLAPCRRRFYPVQHNPKFGSLIQLYWINDSYSLSHFCLNASYFRNVFI